MKFNENFSSKMLLKDILTIILMVGCFSVAYNFIVYNDFNFYEKATKRDSNDLDKKFKELTVEEAMNYFEKAILIDARNIEDYLKGHIKNSINIPAKDFENYLDKIFEIPQDTLIIVYCESINCNLSHQLAEKMNIFGFKSIWIMYEGIEGWLQRKLPIVK